MTLLLPNGPGPECARPRAQQPPDKSRWSYPSLFVGRLEDGAAPGDGRTPVAVFSYTAGIHALKRRGLGAYCPSMRHAGALLLIGCIVLGWAAPAGAVVLWSDLGATLAHETGPGSDILGGALKRDDTSSDTLYFKFHVDPLSDTRTEEYFAAFQLYEGDKERLGVGNSLKAWAYSAFNTTEWASSTRCLATWT